MSTVDSTETDLALRGKVGKPNSMRPVRIRGSRTGRVGYPVILAAVSAVALFVVSPDTLNIVNLTAISIMGAVALNIVLGLAGQFSIGNAAFMAVGAYIAAILAVDLGWSFLPTVFAAAFGGGLCGLLVGATALRLKGLSLAVATLSFHFFVIYAVYKIQLANVGSAGYFMPSLPLIDGLTKLQSQFLIIMPFAVLSLIVFVNLRRSQTGRIWTSVHAQEVAAEAMGVDVRLAKLAAFVVSGTIIGVQGALYAYYVGVTTYLSFTLELAITFLAMILIGGVGTAFGCVAGAAFVTALPFGVQDAFAVLPFDALGIGIAELAHVQVILYGLAIIFFILVEPGGLAALWRRLRAAIRTWPLRRALKET